VKNARQVNEIYLEDRFFRDFLDIRIYMFSFQIITSFFL